MTRQTYEGLGRFAPATIANRFGGWGKALQRAGLSPSRHFGVSAAEVVEDLRRVAGQVGVVALSRRLYDENGNYSEGALKRHFGGWVDALQAAGLQVSADHHPRAKDEELLSNLEVVWESIGRQPKRDDMVPPKSRFGPSPYVRRFGSWRKALEAFVEAVSTRALDGTTNVDESHRVGAVDAGPLEQNSGDPTGRSRGVGWRLRHLVMARDRFACRNCGRAPANHPGVVLHVDHMVPWSRGGRTIESNLQTLCEQCNIGKGAT